MNHSCQSASTLSEMLREAAGHLARAHTGNARSLTTRIGELQQSLHEAGSVSSQAEQEIVSIYVLAELERARGR